MLAPCSLHFQKKIGTTNYNLGYYSPYCTTVSYREGFKKGIQFSPFHVLICVTSCLKCVLPPQLFSNGKKKTKVKSVNGDY